MTEAVFLPDGDTFIPTEHAAGPWDPGALHGGAPAALMARAIEAAGAEEAMFTSRVTFEFMRAVPMSPLRLFTEVIRPGRKVQLVEARLQADGRDVARATGLRIRELNLDVPPQPQRQAPRPPESGTPVPDFSWRGFGRAVDPRLVSGSVTDPGPATVWFRLQYPILPGEEPSPLMRAVAAADFGNGISRVVDWNDYLFINPDLTVYLHRRPRGEWIALEATTTAGPNGVGLTLGHLYDRDGHVGSSSQSLLLERRPT
jgi:hypothetical protein